MSLTTMTRSPSFTRSRLFSSLQGVQHNTNHSEDSVKAMTLLFLAALTVSMMYASWTLSSGVYSVALQKQKWCVT